jgi:membrane associated rhomboid family serine protease
MFLEFLYNFFTGKKDIFFKKFPCAMLMMSVVQLSMFWCDYKFGSYLGQNNVTLIKDTFRLEPCLNVTELWRPVTYMFAHADKYHLLSNIVIQMLSVSCILETEHKPPIIYLIYFVGGLVGGLGHLALNCIPLVGCSGGVFALVAANLSYTILVRYFLI